MKTIHISILMLAVAAAFSSTNSLASEPPDVGDEMVVVGQSTEGSVVCDGFSCRSLFNQLRMAQYFADMMQMQNMEISLEATVVEHDQFCDELEESKPEACGSSPPATPRFSFPIYAANGCGAGDSPAEWFFGEVLIIPGTLNDPLPGVSFREACNNHDTCYGMNDLTQRQCDDVFMTEIRGACAGAQECLDLTVDYYTAVRVFGDAAYAEAAVKNACAAWHHEMDANNCRA